MQTKPSGGSWADYREQPHLRTARLVTSALFGNGASSTWTFNPNALYRLAALQTQGQGGTTIQNFAYTYDPVGNITHIANTASTTNSGTDVYSYQFLNRLASASSLLSTTLYRHPRLSPRHPPPVKHQRHFELVHLHGAYGRRQQTPRGHAGTWGR